MRVVITGADGFVGRVTCSWFERCGHEVVRLGREHGDIAECNEWERVLRSGDTIVHLAARAHVVRETSAAPLEEFRRVNLRGTTRLAEAGVSAGARRLIFVSSIGVNGSSTTDRPFTEHDAPHPDGPYALSKLEAEMSLRGLAERQGMEWVIVRPPLIYGPNAKGNMKRLMRLVASGVPLPVASLCEPRSFAGVDNLCSFLCACAEHAQAANNLFLIADGEDLSVAELIEKMARAMGRHAVTFACPRTLLASLAWLAGRAAEFEKLAAQLRVDATKARTLLDWQPPISVDSGIASMVQAYRGCPAG